MILTNTRVLLDALKNLKYYPDLIHFIVYSLYLIGDLIHFIEIFEEKKYLNTRGVLIEGQVEVEAKSCRCVGKVHRLGLGRF